ncbi:MAG: CARDB domain-containing protein [Chloroflexota bacterium]
MKHTRFVALTLLLLVLSACSPVIQAPTQNNVPTTSPLPDLTITSAYVSMVDGTGVCLSYYGLIVTVANQGGAPAPDVILAENNTGQQVGIGTINAGQSITMPFVAEAPNGAYTVMVDPQNAIAEANEANNSAAFAGPTATPPASCLPVQLGTSTFTPPPFEHTLTPSFTPPPVSNLIGYYYFVPANSPVPQGSVVIASTYILAPAKLGNALSSDPAADLTLALSTVIGDPRNLWNSSRLEIAAITFTDRHVDVLLQGEIFGVGDVTLIAARMQILMTIFAHPAVRDARVTFNGDTIANWGVSSSMEAKPADYIFNRMEIEAFMANNAYKAP